MDELANSNGRGSLGTATNSPISDGGTMARTQNRPGAPQGAAMDAASPASGARSQLTEADRRMIDDIHTAKHLDGSHLRLDELMYLRNENVRMQAEALREFGPKSSTVNWFQNVIEAYDEEIAKAKSPLGAAINAVRAVLADPYAKEKDRAEKVSVMIGIMRQRALMGTDDDPREDESSREASRVLVQVIERGAKETTAALDNLVNQEKRTPGSVSEDKFREAVARAMGVERQKALMGLDDDDKPSKAMELATESLNLVADRRIATLKGLIDQEKRSPGSVSEVQFTRLVSAVLGDERQKQLMGISDDSTGGIAPVIDVLEIVLKKRRDAMAELFKKQAVPGSGITNRQIDQAISDYEAVKRQAQMLGVSVPDAPDIPDQPFTAKPG